MRTYYIFNINNYFTYMYKNKPYRIYKILEEMYNVKKSDIVLSYKLFEQIAYSFNKNKLNEYVNYLFKYNTSYYNRLYSHIICNNQEYTKLTINNSNIKIKSNINYPSFLDILINYSDNIFVCDFINKDYFWLCKLVEKDCKKSEYEVK